MKNCLILSGLPGSGKTTWTKKNYPEATVCSADDYFTRNGEYDFDPGRIQQAHSYCIKRFITALQDSDETVVIDNTNLNALHIAAYWQLARAYGYDVTVVDFLAPRDTAMRRQTHAVPVEAYDKMVHDQNILRRHFPKGWRKITLSDADWKV